ncbi:MAG: hypothetical protein GC151_11065 [Betaproteobacteria bacterium]|nr:hypothetical protein [Betaproteobacteria bacterium]
MPHLPDPRPDRRLPDGHPFAARVAALEEAGAGERAHDVLVKLMSRALEAGDGESVRSAVLEAPHGLALKVARAADEAINRSDGTESGASAILSRVFLVPVLFVTAGAAPARVPGVVPDVAELRGIMRDAGALGPVENFALANALGTAAAVRAASPATLHALSRAVGDAAGVAVLEPAPIELASADEQVHLRFMAGVSVTRADAPTFLETAGQVGRWGMAFSKALARQMASPGLSVLALPRAPMTWYAALAEGRHAREEIAFSLFASNAIRRIRTETGDPVATVAVQQDAKVRIDLISPFDSLNVHSHLWPLCAFDDLGRIEHCIRELLLECRVARVEFVDRVVPPAPLSPPPETWLMPQ